MDATYAASTSESSPHASRIVEAVDRYFFCGWIGFYVLLPVSGWAGVMFASWFDQKRDLAALRSVLDTGHSPDIASNGIGPAYIAAAAVVHWASRLSPEDSLVYLTRGSYVLAVALGVILVRALVRALTDAPPMVTIGAQFAFVGLVFAAGTWHWSDVPWSHFLAAFLAAAAYAIRFVPARLTVSWAAVLGSALALLWLTRSFEFVAVLLAWAIAGAVLFVLRIAGPPTLRVAHVVSGAAAFLATTVAVYGITGKRDLFLLYSQSFDRQAGSVGSAETATTPTFSWSFVPTKLVQLFVEPCYDALCSVADYAGGARPLPPELSGGTEAAGNTRLWRLPLAIQLPSLLLLPICIVALVALVVWAARRRPVATPRVRGLRALIEMTVASTGLVVGYAASTLTGSPHLRYGFARDFLLPALLSGIVGISLAGAGLWVLLSKRRSRLVSSESVFVACSFVAAAVFVAAFAYARADGIPRIESRQLGGVTYTATCSSGGVCRISVATTTTSGTPIRIPEASTLTFGCGSDVPRLSLYSPSPTDGVRVASTCARPRLVAAWPTVMGLPPGSYELSAVKVRNA